MADSRSPQDLDLERTDRLPVIAGTLADDDVEDDAVRMDPPSAAPRAKAEFARPNGVDLPTLAESVRSVEERISRKHAEYEALNRSFEKTRAAEAAAVARAEALAAELQSLRAQLEAAHGAGRDKDQTIAERSAAAEAARARMDAAVREAERHEREAEALRATLGARDATISQVSRSLAERDAQLNALQREHAKVVPALEERSNMASQLEEELRSQRARTDAVAADLKTTQQFVANLTTRLKGGEQDLTIARRELQSVKSQAAAYLERLATHEWRRGFDENLFRDLDAKIGVAQQSRGALQTERDQLRQQVAELEIKMAVRDEAIAKLKSASVDDEENRIKDEMKLRRLEAERTELAQQVAQLDGERTRLNTALAEREESIAALTAATATAEAVHAADEMAVQRFERTSAALTAQIAALQAERNRLQDEAAQRDAAAAEAAAGALAEVQRREEALAAVQDANAKLLAQIEALRSSTAERDARIEVLQAHLKEARGPVETIQSELKRLQDQLSVHNGAMAKVEEENAALRITLERTRGALEEREFLIRRLERSESNNANVLGRIQTSIERLGAVAAGVVGGSTPFTATGTGAGGGGAGGGGAGGGAAAGAAASLPAECLVDFLRVDGEQQFTYTVTRRTRIGRAPGCEMQIESSSVSRHHALVLLQANDVVIEDMHSTNGVLVNGRKVSRAILADGDLLAIGEAQFRVTIRQAPRVPEAPTGAEAPKPPPSAPTADSGWAGRS